MQKSPVLIVFSHLRWDFVYQRPQHLLSRLARTRGVIFIEEPVFEDRPDAFLEQIEAAEGVLVLRPHTPLRSHGYSSEQMAAIKPLIEDFLRLERLHEFAVWFYTPMALPLADGLAPRAVIYDCMDELSKFLHAPPELLERERHLLQFADVVFTGGPSLYRAKKDLHPNVHCFPSSVDARHFAQAKDPATEAAEQRAIPHPRLGYFGVIDERLDLPLIEAMAGAHPEWQIAMVGPVAKIDPAALPRRPNIHYYGQRAYADLPGFLAGWDLAIMPFALNESTKFISPTKVLEYMAAEKPIASSPIADVAEPYGDFIYIGSGAREFIARCEEALAAPAAERERRARQMRQVLSRTSWDETAAAMERSLAEAVKRRRPQTADTVAVAAAPAAAHTPKTLVIGAGPTGLSAAYHLGQDALLLEQNDRVGGWCRSIEIAGFTFDYAGHIMFSNEPYVHEMYRMLLGENVHWQDREAWIYSKNVYTRYPFQGSLYGLPPAVIKECIVGAIEARYGALKPKASSLASNGHANGQTNGHAGGKTNGKTNGKTCSPDGEAVKDCCADGVLESTARLGKIEPAGSSPGEPRNFEEFIYKVWGAGIARHFAIPYNRKLWAVPLSEMETSWLGGRVPLPDLEEMIEGALSPAPRPMGPNARFGYPLRGGFQALMDGFLPYIADRLRMRTRVVAVSPRKRTITLSSGEELPYEYLISTMPLPILIRQMGDEAPAKIRQAAASLRHVSVRCVHIGVGRENVTEKHWIYYPEDTVFHRIFVQGNASPYCNPPGGFGLTCEITYSEHKPLPCEGDALIERCIRDCRQVGIIGPEDPIRASAQCDLPFAYVVYDHGRTAAVAAIREWLREQRILLAGRYSEWEYYNSDHAFIAGKKAAEEVKRLREAGEVSPALFGAQEFEAAGK